MPPRKAAGDELFVARRSFAALVDGRTVIVRVGQMVAPGDPILVGRQDLFAPFNPQVRNYPGRVEQATAAPGEKRT